MKADIKKVFKGQEESKSNKVYVIFVIQQSNSMREYFANPDAKKR